MTTSADTTWSTALAVALALGLVLAMAPAVTTAAMSSQEQSGVTNATLTGTGVATHEGNTTYVWQSGHVAVDVTLVPLGSASEHTVCLRLLGPSGTVVSEQGCTRLEVPSHGTKTGFNVQTLGTNATGNHTFELTVEQHGATQTTRIPIYVITKSGDLDSDSLNNREEVKRGTGLTDSDTDSDGLHDGLEVTKYDSYAKLADSDRDGLRDGREVDIDTDPRNPDTDGDGLTDGEEVNRYDTNPKVADTDDDGLPDGREVELGTIPTTADSDSDGLSDGREADLGTDPLDSDTDGDGLSDSRELDLGTDPLDSDTDGDGISDGEELEEGTDPLDPSSPLLGAVAVVLDRYLMLVAGIGAIVTGLLAAAYMRYDGDGDDFDASDGAAGSTTGAASTDVDPELLTPEQHVEHLLDSHDGRMKQSAIVEETGWSKAKVSRTLSAMEDEGALKRVRIGRENVVAYPSVDLGDDV